jgi:hypothetical protein
MTLAGIVVGIVLFLFLALVTLMINPPEKWVQMITGSRKKKDSK